jgi:hypothetical protein
MKGLPLSIAVCLVVAFIAGAIWLERRHLACQRRGADFSRQVEEIRRGASEEMKVGASKADVGRFYEKRGIHFQLIQVTYPEAIGTIFTTGCSPFGCGTDVAFIVVRVRLNPEGVVSGQPQVLSGYKNCL